jgi:hypothetical protein
LFFGRERRPAAGILSLRTSRRIRVVFDILAQELSRSAPSRKKEGR